MGIADDIVSMTKTATNKWAKQRKAEDRGRARSRATYYVSNRVNYTDVAEGLIAEAYDVVSGGGTLPAAARQLYYHSRDQFREKTGREISYTYFSQKLLRKFAPSDAWITFDERGTFMEPHTEKDVALGTLDVDGYLKECREHAVGIDTPELDLDFPTCGRRNRISAILFVEKEGFNPLFKQAKLAERYDLAIMSTKGQSTTAARKLLDFVAGEDIPVLILHDFDKAGFLIANAAAQVTDEARDRDDVKYEFISEINAIDIGVRLEDVETYGLVSETCKPFDGHNLPGATPEEVEFLRGGQRVELNAFSSPDLIAHIEAKLEEHGVEKVIPDEDVLAGAFRRALRAHKLNEEIRRLAATFDCEQDAVTVPDDIKDQVASMLSDRPEMPWDEAVAEIAEEESRDAS